MFLTLRIGVSDLYDGGVQETYTYDSYGRLENRLSNISTNTNVLTDTLTYESGTARVSSLRSKSRGNYDVTHSYSYENNGNIKTNNTALYDTSYVYDTANQLIRENNEAAGKTWVWTYDDAGNITSRKEYAYNTGTLSGTATTVNYGYSTSTWGDLLTSFKGKTVTSDAIGNITRIDTNYRVYNWEHGRQLASSSYNGGATWTYSYNVDGMRYKRTSGNAAYTYYYNGDLLRYVDYDSNTTDSQAAAKLYFVLDASGKPIEVSYRPEGSTTTSFYYYVHNLQGDVEALVDYSTGNAVVWYTYDAWGNVLSVGGSLASTLGKLNPFRYRSYVYDEESKLYYLQSRYYDPELGRFINADALTATGQGLLGNNMFAYCNNNPTNNLDTLGLWTISISGACSGVFGLGISFSFGFALDDQGNFDWQYSYAVPGVDNTSMVGLVGVGAGVAIQYTEANTVYDLYGPATYVGASAGPGWYIGGDIVSFSDASNPEMTTDGFQFVAGVGVGVDAHVTESYTRSAAQTNRPAQSSCSSGFGPHALHVALLY